MRILIEQDDGAIIEACLHEKTGEKCVVLPPHTEKIVGV